MTDEMIEIVIIASEGRGIDGCSRRRGETISLPAKLARQLLKEQPGAFALPEQEKKPKKAEVNNAD